MEKNSNSVACFAPIVSIAGNPANRPPGQAAAAARKKTPQASAERLGPAETLSRTIANVDLKRKLVIVTSSSVSYNFAVGPSTRIVAGERRIKLVELASDANKPTKVKILERADYHG